MACAGAVMAVEESVFAVLDGEVAYKIDGDTLTLSTGETGLAYRAG